MPFYLGPPGALLALPYAGRGVDASLSLAAVEHRALSGARTVDRVGSAKRTYRVERRFLTVDEVSLLEQLAMGLLGAEPYVLIDPWRRNHLSANRSTAGDAERSTAGFYTTGVGTLSLAGPGSQAARGRYNIRYASPASGAAATAGVRLADSAPAADVIATGIPVLPSTQYTFSALVKSQAGTAQNWYVALVWYDAAGAATGSPANGTQSVVTGAYGARTVTGTSPATAAYVIPQLLNGAALTASNTVDIDDLMLTQGTSTAWALGTGVPRVAFTDLAQTYPIADAADASFTLLEVG